MGGSGVSLVAIDKGTVYWEGARGLVGLDLSSGESQAWEPGAEGSTVTDVEDGRFAFHTGQGSVVGTTPGEGVDLATAYGSVGALSPDGRYYSSEGDEQAVFDTTTGEQVRLDLEQRFATGYEWLDDSTLAVLAAARPQMDATAQLVTCSVPDGACQVVVEDLGTFDELEGFALPTGDDAGVTHTLAGPDGSGACQRRHMASSRHTRHTPPPTRALTSTGRSRLSPHTASAAPASAGVA